MYQKIKLKLKHKKNARSARSDRSGNYGKTSLFVRKETMIKLTMGG